MTYQIDHDLHIHSRISSCSGDPGQTSERILRYAEENGYNIVCAEEKTDNVLGECPLPLPILLVIGGEKRGISRSILDLADTLVKINYAREFKASLSAASATTMFAFEIMRQNKR